MAKTLTLVNGIPRLVEQTDLAIYDEIVTIGGGGLTTGSPLTLPSSKSFTGSELEIYFNNTRLDLTLDYEYVGPIPHTQVSFTFDLEETDVIRFRIDRTA